MKITQRKMKYPIPDENETKKHTFPNRYVLKYITKIITACGW